MRFIGISSDGAADTVTGLAFGYVDEILAYLKDNSEV